MAAFCLEAKFSKSNSTNQSALVDILVTRHVVNFGNDEYRHTPHRKSHKNFITSVVVRLIFGAVDLDVMFSYGNLSTQRNRNKDSRCYQ